MFELCNVTVMGSNVPTIKDRRVLNKYPLPEKVVFEYLYQAIM